MSLQKELDKKLTEVQKELNKQLAEVREIRHKCQEKVSHAYQQLKLAQELKGAGIRPDDTALYACIEELIELLKLTYGEAPCKPVGKLQ